MHPLWDRQKINAVMENVGALQPGLPPPTMISRDWHLTAIDLKDCFFNISLQPDDAPKFAFSVPSANMQVPLQRYHWVVLLQWMESSPTICQWFVTKVLSPIQQRMADAPLYHYMEDILVAAEKQVTEEAWAFVITAVTPAELCVAPEKIQCQPPWKYFGWCIRIQTITSQPLQIQTDIHTLQDAQKL